MSRQRILCLWLPDLVLCTALRIYPELAGSPVIVGGAPSEPRPVVACSVEAEQAGVRPGMRLKEAQSCCPGAVFLPEMPEHVQNTMVQIVALIAHVSPEVEKAKDGQVFIALEGLQRLWPDEQALAAHVKTQVALYGPLATRIGIADTKFAAQVAAYQHDLLVVAPGADASFLDKQPIDRLPAPASMLDALRALGVDTLGAFAALPTNAVVMRFGTESRHLQLLARGYDDTRVVAPADVPSIEARIVFERGEIMRERLLWIMERRLRRLYHRMDRAGLVPNTLHVTLLCGEDRILQDALPIQEPLLCLPELQQLLRWHVEAITLPAPVDEVTLALGGMVPMQGRQLDLFARRQAGDVRRLLGELQARWGPKSVMQPQLVRSRRLEAAFAWSAPTPADVAAAATELRPQPLLRLLPVPRPIDVTLVDGRPATLLVGSRREPIVSASGPWQICERWWDDPLERDEYQICTSRAIYYVAYDRLIKQWSLLGAFD